MLSYLRTQSVRRKTAINFAVKVSVDFGSEKVVNHLNYLEEVSICNSDVISTLNDAHLFNLWLLMYAFI